MSDDQLYAIGDYVWIDADGDGKQDAGEKPLHDVTVTLLDAEGKPVDGVASVKTDEHGFYRFDNLPAGKYKVKFTLTADQAAAYDFMKANESTDGDKADSDADPSTGITDEIDLGPDSAALQDAAGYNADNKLAGASAVKAAGGIDPTRDAGVTPKSVSVGDYVWWDDDRNGVQDSDEPGINGVELTISRSDKKAVFGSNGEKLSDDELTTTTAARDGGWLLQL
jgi:DNA-directed RNA polymerase II subunit RPB1